MRAPTIPEAGPAAPPAPARPAGSRLGYLDATRAFALLLGVVFHASLSFMPVFMGWAVQDVSTSSLVWIFVLVSHSFRMEVFFLLAGFFARGALHRHGLRHFAGTRAVRLLVPFVVGWFVLTPLLYSGWIMGSASLRGDYDFWAAVAAGFQSLRGLPEGLFIRTHLWFLYYLVMITGLALAGRGLLQLTGGWGDRLARAADVTVAWLADSRFALPGLVAPTALILWGMRGWSVDTPDRSLWPEYPVLLLFGGCYGLGWLLHRQRELIGRFTRLTPERGVLALLGIMGAVILSGFERDIGHPHRTAAHLGFAVSYALMMWTLVLLVIGVFRKTCEHPHAAIRYFADSSYWLYLVHLPVVVWLQVAVAEVELRWALKLAFISGATVFLGLISYDLVVRSTFLGWILNGQRHERVLPRLLARIRRPG